MYWNLEEHFAYETCGTLLSGGLKSRQKLYLFLIRREKQNDQVVRMDLILIVCGGIPQKFPAYVQTWEQKCSPAG